MLLVLNFHLIFSVASIFVSLHFKMHRTGASQSVLHVCTNTSHKLLSLHRFNTFCSDRKCADVLDWSCKNCIVFQIHRDIKSFVCKLLDNIWTKISGKIICK
jgi:hypothetical protein